MSQQSNLYKELGLTEEEYLAKQEAFLSALRQKVNSKRSLVRDHITRTLGRSDQNFLRRASWRHVELLQSSGPYSDAAYRLSKSEPKIREVCNSPQDVYHLTHFTNAFALSILNPDEEIPEDQPQFTMPPTLEVCEYEEQRLENQLIFYHELMKLIPEGRAQQQRERQTQVTLHDVMQALNQINDTLSEIKQHVLEPKSK